MGLVSMKSLRLELLQNLAQVLGHVQLHDFYSAMHKAKSCGFGAQDHSASFCVKVAFQTGSPKSSLTPKSSLYSLYRTASVSKGVKAWVHFSVCLTFYTVIEQLAPLGTDNPIVIYIILNDLAFSEFSPI